MNRNIFIVALIVLVAFATLALSGPHNKDTFFAAASSASNSSANTSTSAAPACTANLTCIAKGDACSTTNITSAADLCAFGLYCIGGTCATDNVGASCNSTSDCYLPSDAGAILPSCSGNICGYAYELGDTCTNSSSCMSDLTCNNDSICDGIPQGSPCNITQHAMRCGYGLYCGYKNNNNYTTCINAAAVGENCGAIPCAPWLYCTGGQCQKQYSVPAGGQCNDDKQCVSGTNCVATTTNSTCQAVVDSLTSCSTDADCTATGGGACTCSQYSGKQFCTGLGYNFDPCTDQRSTLVTCLQTNNCSEATNAPESCCYQNCASDYKKAISCGCSSVKDTFAKCSYSAYCGGFPIWAIIIIIVVAIVLVLGIVLLVFFMMRRRRQYESI